MAGKSQWVFRDFLTPADLLEALAQRAVEKLGLTKIAILKPENRYGIRMAEIMTQAVERHGGRVVKSVSYTPGTYDLSQQMMALGGREPGSTPREEPLPYQALFIPEDAQALVQVAPQLTFYGLNGFVLLGTNLWHEDRLIAQAGPYVQDAVIPSVFFADSEAAPVKDFVAAYRDAYGETRSSSRPWATTPPGWSPTLSGGGGGQHPGGVHQGLLQDQRLPRDNRNDPDEPPGRGGQGALSADHQGRPVRVGPHRALCPGPGRTGVLGGGLEKKAPGQARGEDGKAPSPKPSPPAGGEGFLSWFSPAEER